MQEFIKNFKQAVFGDNIYIRPSLLSEDKEYLIITFDVFLYETQNVVQSWKVTCKNFENYKLVNEFFEDINIFKDHILLWEYSELQAELFYTGKTNKKFELIGELLSKHYEVTKGWIDYKYYLNKSLEWKSIDWLFSGDNGLVASGPTILINEYNTILEKFGLKTSILPRKGKQVKYEVLIYENSFVIAEEFIFELILESNISESC
ncbi:hypothetical protein LOZ80_03750 [Paenibacillus sp. HWE-109]|uniref:hypothetical protein n=1 Tax=Paenibacillus sp. HWE-109 TaxID=1306526 RepID=UPI001EE0CC8B|nr:hypothetical protein [Paenibacillus sp. HWE-109]UKS28065.1 hypothetical protein LOZ80_03750 [Paenibacillus sp. HWE-109]